MDEINKTGQYKVEEEITYTFNLRSGEEITLYIEYTVDIDVDMNYGEDADGNRGVKAVWVELDEIQKIVNENDQEVDVSMLMLLDIENQIANHLSGQHHTI